MSKDTLVADYAMRHQKREGLFHSTAYAHAQNGVSFGTAAGDTFQARRKLDQNRHTIRSFQDSEISCTRYNSERAKSYSAAEDNARFSARRDSYRDNGISSYKDRYATAAQNPMDVAIRRAKFSASGSQARAPKIPSRRNGI